MCKANKRRKQGNRLEVLCRCHFVGKGQVIKKLEVLLQNEVTAS